MTTNTAKIRKGVLIAFGELFLKSKGVRELFKKRLLENISFFLKKEGTEFKILLFHDRIFVESDPQKTAQVLNKIFGISWLAETWFLENSSLDDAKNFVKKNYPNWIKKNQTFALKVKQYENTAETKEKIINEIAKTIKRKVNLSKSSKEIFIEQRKQNWFLYLKKNKAQGGLPAGSSGRILCLISGGIDSPVAAYLMAKRGTQNIWLHFHSYPLISNKSIEKVKELARAFLSYQSHLKVYLIPFQQIQIEIKSKIPAKYRVLLYRRFMLRIAEIIAKKEGCQALITGESLGQVSSQTLPNITITEETIKIPVFRPLIGADKEEIIKIAKEIKTYDISIKPQEDCCTLFTPKHSTAQGKLEEIKNLEKTLNTTKLIKRVIIQIGILKYE